MSTIFENLMLIQDTNQKITFKIIFQLFGNLEKFTILYNFFKFRKSNSQDSNLKKNQFRKNNKLFFFEILIDFM